MKKKIIRATTVPTSLEVFCKGMFDTLKKNYDVVALSSPDPELKIVEDREKIRTIAVAMERRISLINDIKSLCAIYKVFYKEKPDMVHSMTPKAGLLCMMAAWLTRVPVRVHTFTGLVWPTSTGLTRQILKMTDRITCFCATHVIPEGQGVLEDLRDGHITMKKMKVLGYGNIRGIDLNYWKRSSQPQDLATSRPFTFLFVGRIVGDKGINELVSSFTCLVTQVKELKCEKVKACRLVLVGNYEAELDPIKEETRKLIDSMPEIEAVGPKYGEDLLKCYEECDCFVFPSYREGFPNTVIEAGAMELPCIVTDINGAREIIRPSLSPSKGDEMNVNLRLKVGERMSIRENGVVIPSKDADALYDAMLWMMTHDAEREQMAAAARPLVASRFEQGFVRQQLYDFYHEVLG